MLPQRNAYLTKVERTGGTTGGGFTEDYDRPATDPEVADGEGADLWTGKTSCYWIERRRRVTEGQTSRVILERSLLLEAGLPEIQFINGDHVTVRHGQTTKRGQIAQVEHREMPGLPGSVRLTMEDA